MNLRVAPSARATNSLLLLSPLPPAAERCALICVESIICGGHFPVCCGDSSRLASGARRGAATARTRLGNRSGAMAVRSGRSKGYSDHTATAVKPLCVNHLFLPLWMTAKSREWEIQGSCQGGYRTQRSHLAYMGELCHRGRQAPPSLPRFRRPSSPISG
jgi:hypothetical protein